MRQHSINHLRAEIAQVRRGPARRSRSGPESGVRSLSRSRSAGRATPRARAPARPSRRRTRVRSDAGAAWRRRFRSSPAPASSTTASDRSTRRAPPRRWRSCRPGITTCSPKWRCCAPPEASAYEPPADRERRQPAAGAGAGRHDDRRPRSGLRHQRNQRPVDVAPSRGVQRRPARRDGARPRQPQRHPRQRREDGRVGAEQRRRGADRPSAGAIRRRGRAVQGRAARDAAHTRPADRSRRDPRRSDAAGGDHQAVGPTRPRRRSQ